MLLLFCYCSWMALLLGFSNFRILTFQKCIIKYTIILLIYYYDYYYYCLNARSCHGGAMTTTTDLKKSEWRYVVTVIEMGMDGGWRWRWWWWWGEGYGYYFSWESKNQHVLTNGRLLIMTTYKKQQTNERRVREAWHKQKVIIACQMIQWKNGKTTNE